MRLPPPHPNRRPDPSRRHRRPQILALSLIALSIGGCAPRYETRGAVAGTLPVGDPKTFLLVSEDRSHALGADAAVARLLEARGFRQATDAAYRVDVALASSETDIALAGAAPRRDLLSLCKRRRYALSVAMIERRTGKVLYRRDAETRRCGTPTPTLVDGLAEAALAR